ncbi:MAG: ATP-binding protein [Sciscionella sp.]
MTSGGPAAPEDPTPSWFSLRRRVSLLTALTVAIAVALVSLGAYLTVHRTLYNQVDGSLEQKAQGLEHTLAATATQRQSLRVAVIETRFAVIRGNGQLVNGTNPAPQIARSDFAVARSDSKARFRTDESTDSRILTVPFQADPRSPELGNNGYALVLSQPLGPIQHSLNTLAIALFIISGAGVLVAALAGTAVAQGGLRPVLQLTRATERVAATNDLRPIPVTGDDELARLTMSFNTMLGALDASQEQQRQLVADAGHELRTPLTSLRTNLELLLAAEQPGAPTLSEVDTEEIHQDVRAQLDELTSLIGDLVLLARDETPQETAEPVELVDVVERALERAQRRTTNVRFDVRLTPWTVRGDPSALERAVLNLLDNAVKFSPPRGVVGVGLRALGDGTAVIEVADGGPGIADADLPKVFDRFYRSSEARTLPGSGLGLAIVKQATVRNGGSVWAGHAPGGGALLVIRLPGEPG